MGELHVINHPLIQHKLTMMRQKETGAKDFRELLDEITVLMGYEVTRSLPLKKVTIETPLQTVESNILGVEKVSVVPILRAGLGMTNGLLELIPTARVGHIGLYRDPDSHEPVVYYCKLPENIASSYVIVCDPMLATGGSSSDALTMLKKKGVRDMRLMCLVAAPEGVARVQKDHPDIDIYCASLDEKLNDHAYILPGLGDAGDRLYGTK